MSKHDFEKLEVPGGIMVQFLVVGNEVTAIAEIEPLGSHDPKIQAHGRAVCHKEDTFEQNIGCMIAMGKALFSMASQIKRVAEGEVKHRDDMRAQQELRTQKMQELQAEKLLAEEARKIEEAKPKPKLGDFVEHGNNAYPGTLNSCVGTLISISSTNCCYIERPNGTHWYTSVRSLVPWNGSDRWPLHNKEIGEESIESLQKEANSLQLDADRLQNRIISKMVAMGAKRISL